MFIEPIPNVIAMPSRNMAYQSLVLIL